MKLPRAKSVFMVSGILLTAGLLLGGCSAPGGAPGTGADTGGPTGGASTGPWDACPAIVASLSGNADDPFDYEQLDAVGFGIQEVGSDVLERACIIGVTSSSTTAITWAILPGETALAESIKADLLAAGFAEGDDLPGLVGNTTTGQGALIATFDTGAALDDYLVYTTAFTPYDESLVYIGTFALG